MADRILKTALALLVCAALSLGALQAASFTYSDSAKRIKAGVLLTSDPLVNPPLGGIRPDPTKRPDPYIFHVMNQRHDLKPSGWDFYNPLAPSHITTDIDRLWGAQYNTVTGEKRSDGVYKFGESLQRDMGAYWEVDLMTVSPEDLAQYDVLYLTNWGVLAFGNSEREKLRKFVDNGGVLWVDCQKASLGNTQFAVNRFFIPELAFMHSGTGDPAVVSTAAYGHALANRSFYISRNDANLLGGSAGPGTVGQDWIDSANEAAKCFVPVIIRDGRPTVLAAQYGSGYIVVTADGVGQALTEPVKNPGVAFNGKCGTLFVAAHPEDLKLAYNIVNWGSEHSTYHKNPRRTGYSFAEIGGSLVNLWTFTDELGPAPTDSAPAILDDMIFYVDGHSVLHAFDLSPVRDRDMDGNPDDGIPDYSLGRPYDELWKVEIGEPCSPPTAAYAPLVLSTPAVPAVFVVTKSGKVYGFNALTGGPSVEYFTSTVLAPFPSAKDIPAPTYADGMLYVGDGEGALHAREMYWSTSEWVHPKKGTLKLGPAHSPTVGCFYDPISGATEQIVYIATRGIPSSINGSARSYPLRVFNETLIPVTAVNHTVTTADFRVRSVNTFINPPTGTKPLFLWKRESINHTPEKLADTDYTVINPGKFRVTNKAVLDMVADGGTILADYYLQYLDELVPPTDPNYIKVPPFRSIGIWQPAPPTATQGTGVSGSPAAGKNDILYFGTENGSIYAVKETGRTVSTGSDTPISYKWRWYLGDPQAQTALGVTGGTFKVIGAPALHGEMVYVAVNGTDASGAVVGYVLAFKADPVFSITLRERIAPGTQVIIKQVDRMNDPGGATPKDYVAVSYTDMDKATPNTTALVDYDTNKITFINFRARSSSAELTASEDMVVVYTPDSQTQQGAGGQPITEEHKAFALGTPDKLNNLDWYIKLPHPIASSPTIMGDILYAGCEQGILVSLDVAKAAQASGGMVNGVRVKPWNNDYIQAHPVAPGADITAPVAGSHGLLAISSAQGLSIMYNPTSLIADGNRLIEVDASGKAVWTCDSTVGFTSTFAVPLASGVTSHLVYGSANTPFNRPSVARRAPVGGIVVADTGNNRIVHVDKGGNGIWQVRDFVDPNPADPIVTPGTSLELSNPTDVTCWMTMSTVGGYTLPEYHYLIADSGNYRVVEVVAQYDPGTGSYRNILKQVSGNLAEGKKYRFLTARILESNATGPTKLVCAVSHDDSSQPTGQGMGGEIVALDWTTGGLIGKVTGLPLPPPGASAPPTPLVTLMNPTFCNRQWISNNEYADVVIDSKGVHVCEVTLPTGGASGSPTFTTRSYLVTDHVDIDESQAMTTPLMVNGQKHARPFAPSYAQYLPNKNVLVTNKATGEAYYMVNENGVRVLRKRAFRGEVFELKPGGTNGLERVPGSSNPNPDVPGFAELMQPLSAERLMY